MNAAISFFLYKMTVSLFKTKDNISVYRDTEHIEYRAKDKRQKLLIELTRDRIGNSVNWNKTGFSGNAGSL